MNQYKDKNQTILKPGDKLKNKKGEVGQIQNIRGVSMLVYKENGKIIKSPVMSKADVHLMEKI